MYISDKRRTLLPEGAHVTDLKKDPAKLPEWHPDSTARTGTSQIFRVIDNSELV